MTILFFFNSLNHTLSTLILIGTLIVFDIFFVFKEKLRAKLCSAKKVDERTLSAHIKSDDAHVHHMEHKDNDEKEKDKVGTSNKMELPKMNPLPSASTGSDKKEEELSALDEDNE